MVKLGGVNRRMPALVANASQLVDPDGLIHADWKVSGRHTTIQPGVTLNFAAGYRLRVYDDLRAIGTEADSIRFSGTDWEGIYADPDTDGTVEMSYCVVEHTAIGHTGLSISGNALGGRHSVRHTVFRDCPGVGLWVLFSLMDLSNIRVEGCETGLNLFETQGRVEELELAHNDVGLRLESWNEDESSYLRRVLIRDSSLRGAIITSSSLTLENVTLRDNLDVVLQTVSSTSLEL